MEQFPSVVTLTHISFRPFYDDQHLKKTMKEIRHIQESLLTASSVGYRKAPAQNLVHDLLLRGQKLPKPPVVTSVSSSEATRTYAIEQHQRPVWILIFFFLTWIVQVRKKPEKHIKNIVAFNRKAGFLEPPSMSVRQHFLQSGWHFDSGLCGCSDCFERGEVCGHITP